MINWPEKVQLVENKYSKWYSNLIVKAQARNLPKDVYTEKHHIIPKSWQGSDTKDNIVRLTAKEHYMAHAFLWKMNVGIGFHNKMVHAFNAMSIMKDGSYNKPGYRINSRLFESVRLERIAHLKTLTGPLSPAWGKKLNISKEGKQKRLNAVNEMWSNPTRRTEILKNRELSNQRPEVIAKRKSASNAKIGVKRDPLVIEKTAAKKRGKKAHEIFSPEALANIAEGRKHRVISPEARAKWSEVAKAQGSKPKSESFKKRISEVMTGIKRPTKVCEHCGIECVVANYNRWHGANCKKFTKYIILKDI